MFRLIRLTPYPNLLGEQEEKGDPPNSIRTEKVASVSRKKETDCPDTVMITHGSQSEMVVVRPKDPMARLKRSPGG